MKYPLVGLLILAAAALPGATADDLFDDAAFHDIRLTLDPADWAKLQENYLSNDYYRARLEWAGRTVENVGIRSRGFGSRNGYKPGLKVDFNEFVSQEFLGLKSVVLDNLVQDAAMMSERLSLALFRRMGLRAPRLAHVRLYINENYAGVYTVVEPVDKTFLRRVYGEDKGDLYDYGWAFDYHFEYLGEDPGLYAPVPFEPKTNTSTFDGARLVAMTRLAAEAGDEEFAARIGEYLDVEAFLPYLATETYTGDLDGFLGEWGVNNFYLYRRPGVNQFQLIPWDKDLAFRDPSRPIWQNLWQNPLAWRILSIGAHREAFVRYLAECAEMAGGQGGWLEGELTRTHEQIRVAALEDPKSPYSFEDFEYGVEALRTFLHVRPAAVMAEIDALLRGSDAQVLR